MNVMHMNVFLCFIDLTLSVTYLHYHHICIHGKTGSDGYMMDVQQDIPTCIVSIHIMPVQSCVRLSVNRRYSIIHT